MIKVINSGATEKNKQNSIDPRGGCDCAGTYSQKDTMSSANPCGCVCWSTLGKTDGYTGAYYS